MLKTLWEIKQNKNTTLFNANGQFLSKHSIILVHIPNIKLHMKWKQNVFFSPCTSATFESQNTFVLTIAKCCQDMKRLKGNAVSWCARLCIAVAHVSMVTLLRDTLY